MEADLRAVISKEEAEEITLRGLQDPAFFFRTFFPTWFELPMPWVHRGVLAILSKQSDWLLNFGEEVWPRARGLWDEKQLDKIVRHFVWREEPEDLHSPMVPIFKVERDSHGKPAACHMGVSDRTLIIMPRGISKTTLVNAHNLRKIAYHDADFIVYLSETATHAEQQLENIRREISSNHLYISIFGSKQPDRADPERWTQDLIETTDGVVVVAKGRGSQVRGLNHRGKRPQDIIFDDLEDKKSVKNDTLREETKSWLKSDVEQALPQIDGQRIGRIVGLGTVLHHDSLILSLARDPEWLTVKFGAIDPDGDMTWGSYMTMDQYERKRRSFVRIGKLADFNMEFNSTVRSDGENQKFPSQFTYAPSVNYGMEFPARALVMDPAISDKKDSDFCAFAVVGMTPRGIIHVLDIFMDRGMTPRSQIDKYFELHFAWDCNKHGIEAIAYQKALIHLMKEEMFRKGKTYGSRAYFEIDEIKHGNTGKIERVEGVLSPRYAAGYITHQRRFPEYEEQLLDWPNGKKDGPDVVAMAITLLDPLAAFAYDAEDEDEDKLAKDQYPALDRVFEGDWRSAP
jgi:hypothetical protein